jgi:hypothetical protein
MQAIGTLAGFILTLLIFSYLLGDNWFYRLAVYTFVGVSAAFTTIVTFEGVIVPIIAALADGEATPQDLLGAVVLFTATIFVLPMLIRRIPGANIPLAFLIAVGAAVSILGALVGTVFTIMSSTVDLTLSGGLNGVLLFVGVVTSLLYFQYIARRRADGTPERGRISNFVEEIGLVFITVTLGALYGTAILTSLTILTTRLSALVGGGA